MAIVTGSDSGIGRAIPLALEGADVAVTFHDHEEGARATARQVQSAGRQVLVQRLDVSEEGSVADLFQTVDRTLGTPHLLVNNVLGPGQAARF
ncbi:hypothetical protein X739_28325 [Mesorhizobium sp. LNHC220B00]|nr:SDR family NAD(P)-dependent oxidoreductase [Mesorhizobium sp. LNHC220B00]ESY81116.1 hypothetical protein X739_28325 [Mesorhizobium sp. LNHC220B00]